MPENFLSNSIKTTVEIGRRMPKRPFKQHKNYGRIWRKDAGKLPFKTALKITARLGESKASSMTSNIDTTRPVLLS